MLQNVSNTSIMAKQFTWSALAKNTRSSANNKWEKARPL